ncbi:allantoinase PuuE [Ferrovibrio sp.]|uniref:allantoinase PuuE n=1 Tax=Ferrovibrio sp. TaxID=1917215 RepID=UPI001B66B353|nr:allantoinase PuuE [Ferrovibrio sp.]MBP7063404.1 allantoinase PuuE [Ferrovibrio sp.]
MAKRPGKDIVKAALGPKPYPRDLRGYGAHPPDPRWPGQANVAVSFVVNYEEGGERSILHGDKEAEVYLHEVQGGVPRQRMRDEQVESVYDYGARAGFWRLMRLFQDRRLNFTSYAVGMAVARYPEAARAMAEQGHEIASHGWRWYDYSRVPLATERAHMKLAIAAIEQACGQRPVGWYTGRLSSNTRQLVIEEGGFLYDSDAYDDDLPYWVQPLPKRPAHLVIPYTFDNNDMKFGTLNGFGTGQDFYDYLKDAFDCLYDEGRRGSPKMMSVGLHCRLAGRPGRAQALARFLDYIQGKDKVWICRRQDIAQHWHSHHKPKG